VVGTTVVVVVVVVVSGTVVVEVVSGTVVVVVVVSITVVVVVAGTTISVVSRYRRVARSPATSTPRMMFSAVVGDMERRGEDIHPNHLQFAE
jgi:hypothetical protein